MNNIIEYRKADGTVVLAVNKEGRITAESIDLQAAGMSSLGKINSQQDVDVQQADRGLILKSPDGTRKRLTVTDNNVSNWVPIG